MTTMEMDRDQAARKADQYDEAIARGRAVPGDEELREGYRAMARGKCILDLHTVFAEAGLDTLGRPKLAIVRADAKRCTMTARSWINGSMLAIRFDDARHVWNNNPKGRIQIPREVWRGQQPTLTEKDYSAIVPSIPPEHRRGATKLRDYHILWEAEWGPNPPVDPYLLKHITGTLYVVLAQWDLTPLEQAVLRSRIGS